MLYRMFLTMPTKFEGAYFAKDLNLARAQGRIGKLAADPLLRTKLSF
ncbi:MAG: hypothetical protein RL109_1071 [Pseudomonadota bacterium]|jgi:hypothetical protein